VKIQSQSLVSTIFSTAFIISGFMVVVGIINAGGFVVLLIADGCFDFNSKLMRKIDD